MCGIFGMWNVDGRPVSVGALHRATNAIRHRGPDDEGYLLADPATGRAVECGGDDTDPRLALPPLATRQGQPSPLAFGFRRLSILDLSLAGHQPMASADRRYWIVFNGEIYNYLELRDTLSRFGYRFRSGTDTEVILAAFEHWGRECLGRFNGMWAFAIWDVRRRELFLARDRFGVKPLYYSLSPDGLTLAFASEMKALFAAGAVSPTPSSPAVARYAAFGWVPDHQDGATFFVGVKSLPAAHYAVFGRGGLTSTRYWALPEPEQTPALPPAEATRRYRDLFTDAVRVRLRADVPVGTCLSGGLDSSSIVAAAGRLMRDEHPRSLERLGARQQTFSAVYTWDGPFNEKHHVDSVLASCEAAGNRVVPTGERLHEELHRLVWHQEEPFGSTSVFAQWCVMHLVRQRGVTVLLDGQGADEVLAGYAPCLTVYFRELLNRGRMLHACRQALRVTRNTAANGLAHLKEACGLELRTRCGPRPSSRVFEGAARAAGLVPDLGRALAAQGGGQNRTTRWLGARQVDHHLRSLIHHESLPELLRYEDRNSMAFSVEGRLPFLDYRLVEFVFRHGSPYRIRDGWTKWLHRAAVEDLLPRTVTWRRDKIGFATPEHRWLAGWGPQLADFFAPGSALAAYLDVRAAGAQAVRQVQGGETAQVWRWINLAVWLQVFARPFPDSAEADTGPPAPPSFTPDAPPGGRAVTEANV